TYSRHQRPRSVLHHTQDGCRGSLGKNQAGWQCDQYNNRCCEISKRTQTNTHSPYHIPLLSNTNLQIRKSIWQASRPWPRLNLASHSRKTRLKLVTLDKVASWVSSPSYAKRAVCRRLFCSWRTQNKSFSANWICREVVAVAVMTPPEGLYSVPWKRTSFGYEK